MAKKRRKADDAWVLVTKSGRPIMYTLSPNDDEEPMDLFHGGAKWTRKFLWHVEGGEEAYREELKRRGYRVVRFSVREAIKNK